MSDQPDSEARPARRRFKHTRELMKIAVADGMTQDQIARVCRTQQSTVHKWIAGKGLAYEDQLVELRKRYASRLNRVTSRVYLLADGVTIPSGGASPRAAPPRLACVEGPVVFRYTFVRIEKDPRDKRPFVRVPLRRWIVHRQDRDRFVLIELVRRELTSEQSMRAQNEGHVHSFHDSQWVESDDDASRWAAVIAAPTDAAGLIALCDRYFGDPARKHNPHDQLTLPFLIRKMLVEQGQDVPGVDRLLASE